MCFDVTEAGTGEQALTLLGEHPYDVVLLGLEMRGMDGIETCREMRRLGHDTSVLILTASGSKHARALAFEAGANDYITKPFILRDLMRSPDLPEILIAAGLVAYIACAVHNWLHRRQGQQRRSRSNSFCEEAAKASETAPT